MSERASKAAVQNIDTRRAEGQKLVALLEGIKREKLEVMPRDGALAETIKSLLEKGLYVVVDRGTGLVFGMTRGFMFALMADLYRYHKAKSGTSYVKGSDMRDADRFIDEGMGYYLNDTESNFVTDSVVQAGEGYMPDKDDEKVFEQHGVHRYPKSK